jgi:hypothetical protein
LTSGPFLLPWRLTTDPNIRKNKFILNPQPMKNTHLLSFLGALLLAATASQAQVTSGLVAYYPLDGNANDASGNNFNGTAYNGVTYSPGLSGLAANFSGASQQYIALPTAIPVTSAFTVAFWLNTADTTANTFPYGLFLVSRDIPNANYDWNICLGLGRKLEFHTGTPTNDSLILTSTSDLPANEWVHVTCVADAAAGMKDIYLNGQLAASTPWVPTTFANSIVPIYLAASTANPFAHLFLNGSMDEVRFYDRALSASEVMTLVPEPATTTLAVLASCIGLLCKRAARQTHHRTWRSFARLPGFPQPHLPAVGQESCQATWQTFRTNKSCRQPSSTYALSTTYPL